MIKRILGYYDIERFGEISGERYNDYYNLISKFIKHLISFMAKTLLLGDLEIYELAMKVGELVWNSVVRWEYFPKKTVGIQYVEAADSIAANIAEDYGRYFYKDRKQFCYYSRGSIMETKTWTANSK